MRKKIVRKKMAAWNPGATSTRKEVPPFACSSPTGFHLTFFSSRFSFASRTTDKAKEGLLVVYSQLGNGVSVAKSFKLQFRWAFIANPYHKEKHFILIHKCNIIFLGVLSVPMLKLFTSKEIGQNTYMGPLFWLLDSAKTTQHLHHVP